MRRVLLIVAVLVALTIGAAAVYLRGAAPLDAPPIDGPPGTVGAGPDPAATGPEVARMLEGLAVDPEAGVAVSAREELAGGARAAVPEGSTVRPYPETWAPDGVGGGTMLVDVDAPGLPPASYLAVLVPEDGTWKVLATITVTDQR